MIIFLVAGASAPESGGMRVEATQHRVPNGSSEGKLILVLKHVFIAFPIKTAFLLLKVGHTKKTLNSHKHMQPGCFGFHIFNYLETKTTLASR